MLSNGAESIRKKTVRDYSFAIEASSAAFPTVLAYLVADYGVPYDVEFRPYLPVRMSENEQSYADIEFDVAENSITGLITVGRNRLSQTIRTIFKPDDWMTWIGTQPLSTICGSWTVEFDGETDNPVVKTAVGIAARKSIDRFSCAGKFSDIISRGGCYFYTNQPSTICGNDEFGRPFESSVPEPENDDCYGICFGVVNDRIAVSVRPISANASAISFTMFCADSNRSRSCPDVFVIPTADLSNYLPFITTNKCVRLLISSSD